MVGCGAPAVSRGPPHAATASAAHEMRDARRRNRFLPRALAKLHVSVALSGAGKATSEVTDRKTKKSRPHDRRQTVKDR